jgi:CheY-like chemotaxis protein
MTAHKPVILVVEDHPIIRMAALDIVRSAGFEGLEAESADQAIFILAGRSDVRLVFTDVRMPGSTDGIRLAHYIRRRWPPVELIVASGDAAVSEKQLPIGARFFPKPYRESTLVQAMIDLLADDDDRRSPARRRRA